MENYEIPDNMISATSEYDDHHAANRGRLNLEDDDAGVGGWSPKVGDTGAYTQVRTISSWRCGS